MAPEKFVDRSQEIAQVDKEIEDLKRQIEAARIENEMLKSYRKNYLQCVPLTYSANRNKDL